MTATINGTGSQVATRFVANAATARIEAGALTVVTDHVYANGEDTNEVQAIVTDAHRNPVPGYTVVFSVNNGAMIAATGVTDDNGMVLIPLTSTRVGIAMVTATVNGNTSTIDTEFVVNSDTAQIADGAFIQVVDGALADGADTNTVQVTVTDTSGHPVPGHAVYFAANNGATIGALDMTDQNGVAIMSLTNTRAGITTVTATVNRVDTPLDTQFVANGDTAIIAAGALTVVTNNAVANNLAANVVKAVVTDAQGNRLNGHRVVFTANNGATMPTSGTTDSNGEVMVSLTNTKSGTTVVSASVNGNTPQTVNTSFVADRNTAKAVAISLSNNGNTEANGTSTNTVSVTVEDQYGNRVTSYSVPYSVVSPSNVTTPRSASTNANGIAQLPVSSTQRGTVKVSATVGGVTLSRDLPFIRTLNTTPNALGSGNIPGGYNTVVYTTANANWYADVILPSANGLAGDRVTVVVNSTYDVTVGTANTTMASALVLKIGQTAVFVRNASAWVKQ